MRRTAAIVPLTAALLLAWGSPAGAQEVPDWVKNTKVTGLFFGDFYSFPRHHDEDVEGAVGFWSRRMYLTFDHKFSSGFDARVRFEAASPGDFETAAKMEPFLKDLWVRWRRGNHAVVLGLSSTPTWNVVERSWGYRSVEKTPLDLYKYGSSRDFGLALQGALDPGRLLRYHVMFANGSGTKSETNRGKKFMGSLGFYPNEHLIVEVYADHEDRPGPTDRAVLQGFALLRGSVGRIGVQYARQTREREGEENLRLDVASIFGVGRLTSRVSVLARIDFLLDPVPDGEKISYLPIAATSRGTFLLAGVDLKLQENVHVVPNVELVSYEDEATETDIALRTTFSVTF